MTPIRVSKIETATRIVLEFNQAFNRHDVPSMVRLINDNCVFDNTGPTPDGAVIVGKETITQYLHDLFCKSITRNCR